MSSGRLGNQLFEIATALEYADAHGMRAYVVVSEKHMPDYNPHLFDSIITRVSDFPPDEMCHEVKDLHIPQSYSKIPTISDGRHMCLKGYFQHARYISNPARWTPVIRSWYPLPSETTPQLNQPFVAMHVRRGDYVRLGWNLNTSYYTKALEHIATVAPGCPVVCFTDDEPWCLEEFPGIAMAPAHLQPHEILSVMSQAHAIIISNSTFSYWSAFVMEPERPVVAPKHWLRNPLISPGFFPDHWYRIDEN